jgi:hypothetical protein
MSNQNHNEKESAEHLLAQLEEKVKQDLAAHQIYEALQYIQSFIARKKKILGQKGTSNAVFLGANLLTANHKVKKGPVSENPSIASIPANTLAVTAGSLLKWFIEDGAGLDYNFHFYSEQVNASHYCDVQNLLNFLNSVEVSVSGPIVDAIYNPLHVLVTKTKIRKPSPLSQRINKLEILFANVFFANKRWLMAFKAFNRLQDAEKLAEVLNNWANDGYAYEKPLFFARGIFQLLSENKVTLANELLFYSVKNVDDNIAAGKKSGGADSPALALWHVATILTDLANFPPMQRVDKTKLFGLLYQRYSPLFAQIDTKLLDLFQKVGEVVFNFLLQTNEAPNPMAMLQSLLTGGAYNRPKPSAQRPQVTGAPNNAARRQAPPSAPATPDFESLMRIISRMGQL